MLLTISKHSVAYKITLKPIEIKVYSLFLLSEIRIYFSKKIANFNSIIYFSFIFIKLYILNNIFLRCSISKKNLINILL